MLSTWTREERGLSARVRVRRVGWQLKVIEKTGDGSFTLLYDTPDGDRTVRPALWHGWAQGRPPWTPYMGAMWRSAQCAHNLGMTLQLIFEGPLCRPKSQALHT